MEACITTSWDDGHPLDLRIAELLTRYALSGTFYVPRAAEHGTMPSYELRELSRGFEIGAHTLDHVVLTLATRQQAQREISDSKAWVEDMTGLQCIMFCPPEGRYARGHLEMVQNAGYLGMRTVELASLSPPRVSAGIALMPTSVQAHPHGCVVFSKNALKRGAPRNLGRYLLYGRSSDWSKLARSLLQRVAQSGGVFHLWGHSWELQQNGQWQRLEEVLRMMSEFSGQMTRSNNGQICVRSLSTGAAEQLPQPISTETAQTHGRLHKATL